MQLYHREMDIILSIRQKQCPIEEGLIVKTLLFDIIYIFLLRKYPAIPGAFVSGKLKLNLKYLGTKEIQIVYRFSLVLCYLLQEPL